MKKIKVITFKGCQPAIDFRNQFEDMIDSENLDAEIEMTFVPAPEKAKEMGLFGSPTILIDGVDVQQKHRGPTDFYCRACLTAEGFRPYPLMNEMVAMLQGKEIPPPKTIVGSIESFPTLVLGDWCPFTLTATDLWKEAANAVGLSLEIVQAKSEEGEKVMVEADVAGVPCLVTAPDRKFYGIHISPSNAKSFLKT